LIYALDKQLDRILAEGLEQALCTPHGKWRSGCTVGQLERDQDLFASQGFRSQTVTTVDQPCRVWISLL
jgi:aspartate aminotransferase-like enzyme